MDRKVTKYSREDRKYIVELIENLKNDDDYITIFDILTQDPANIYTRNSNATFVNLSVLSDTTLDKISKYLKKINSAKSNEINTNTDIIPIAHSNIHTDRTYKLSNYEQNIIKQRNLKKMMNSENEYEELKFNTKNKNLSTPNKPTTPVKSVKPVAPSKSVKATKSTNSAKPTKTVKTTKLVKTTKPTKTAKSANSYQ